MEAKTIHSHADMLQALDAEKRTFVLLYKPGSELSEKAKAQIEAALAEEQEGDFEVLMANLAEVRDIHPAYNITTAPTLLEFDGPNFRNAYKGANDKPYYKALFEQAVFAAIQSETPSKSVTVYTTPTCPWCTTVKNHLRQNRVAFTEIDISRDQNAAQDLVRRSGQQGVPQTDINGQIVVGFDKKKLNQLLEI